MKKAMVFGALVMAAMSPALANANQGSVSFACNTNNITEVNLEGITFMPNQLAAQGFSVSVVNGVMNLNHGTESIVVGTLQPRETCRIGEGTETSFVNFTNLNMAISSEVKAIGPCVDVTSDGVWGVSEAMTVSLVSLDNGSSMVLKQSYMIDFSNHDECEATAAQK